MLKTETLNINDFILKEDIGEGNFGKVKLGIYKETGEEFAIKILNKEKIKNKMKNSFFKENEIAKRFNHINVIYVFEIFEDQENCYLAMELCKKGELFDYIVKHQRLSENEASIFFYQLINGVEYIHSKGISHRDLKPENLLLTNDKILKIIDFGLSHEFNGEDLLKTKCGSPSYAAPEIICCPYYDGFKTDIWCCGIILYAMLCGFLPFEGDDNTLLFRNILECDPEMPDWLGKSSRDLIIRILNPDPNERITLEEIKKHKFYLKGKKLCDINYEEINKIIKLRDLRGKKNSTCQTDNKELKSENNKDENEKTNNNENEDINIKKNENNNNNNNESVENKIYKYNYCNTISGISGNLSKINMKIKPFNKFYRFKINNSINSFRKKIMDLNNNYKKLITMNNKMQNILKTENNIMSPSLTSNQCKNNNNNFNSINSSKNLNCNNQKFKDFLSRLHSDRKPLSLFLKIVSSSTNKYVNDNKIENLERFITNNNDIKLINNNKKKCASFLKKFKQQKKINNYLLTNTNSDKNRLTLNNDNYFRDKLYKRLYSTNVNTPIHIKKNMPITTESNRNYNKNENLNLINNSEPKPILYCGNLNININNININQKNCNNNYTNIKNKSLDLSSNTTKSSSKKISIKKDKKKVNEKYKYNTISSKRVRPNDLINSKNKINLSKIIQKRQKKNKEKKNSVYFSTNIRNITESNDKTKNKENSSNKKNSQSKNKHYKKNNNQKGINIIDNSNQKNSSMKMNHNNNSSKSYKKMK